MIELWAWEGAWSLFFYGLLYVVHVKRNITSLWSFGKVHILYVRRCHSFNSWSVNSKDFLNGCKGVWCPLMLYTIPSSPSPFLIMWSQVFGVLVCYTLYLIVLALDHVIASVWCPLMLYTIPSSPSPWSCDCKCLVSSDVIKYTFQSACCKELNIFLYLARGQVAQWWGLRLWGKQSRFAPGMVCLI